jgi:hypothetical protein
MFISRKRLEALQASVDAALADAATAQASADAARAAAAAALARVQPSAAFGRTRPRPNRRAAPGSYFAVTTPSGEVTEQYTQVGTYDDPRWERTSR